MKAKVYTFKSSGITGVYKLEEDNIPEITESYNKMIEKNNQLIGLAGLIEIF
jgi:hypothetical protein